MTGFKLASPKLMKQMWSEGIYQFVPFLATILAIVFTDLLIGVLIGMLVALGFILRSNFRRPLRKIVEKHLGGEVLHIELADQVSFLNRAALSRELDRIPEGGHVMLDARTTDYIDPDVLDLIHDYQTRTLPARGVELSLMGFQERYGPLKDRTQFVNYSTRELQDAVTPKQVLQFLLDGHARFLSGRRLTRDLVRQADASAQAQHPLAAVLSCIESRVPAEIIFDVGMGDVFSVRTAGNVAGRKSIGGLEYACSVEGAKLVLVVGHTRCGPVASTIDHKVKGVSFTTETGCEHLEHIARDIEEAIDDQTLAGFEKKSPEEREGVVSEVARQNVLDVVRSLHERSATLHRLAEEGKIAIVGAFYDVSTRELEILTGAPE